MAVVRIGSFDGDNVIFEADYNEGNRRITRIRCINNSGSNARCTLIEPDTRVIAAQVTFLNGTTQFNVAGRQVTVEPDGTVNIPYDIRMEYPSP